MGRARESSTTHRNSCCERVQARQQPSRLARRPCRHAPSTGPVVELWKVEGLHPRLPGPSKDVGLRREPLVELIERAFLHVNDGSSLHVVGNHPATPERTEKPISTLCGAR